MPSPTARGRHAAPPKRASRRTVALPAIRLTAAVGAFGGLAVSPSAADSVLPRVTAAEALAPVELRSAANLHLAKALEQARQAAVAAAAKPSPPRAPARASRSRSAPTPVPTAAKATADYARPGLGRRTSAFGRRWGRLHAGIDLAAGTGSPIRAAAAGKVLSARVESGYGKCVRILHPDGTVTVYAHMSKLLVSSGERVAAGEQIGKEGNTGRSTGPHLHFEVRINGTPVNPSRWLATRGVDV